MEGKGKQTIYERAEIGEKAIFQVRKLLEKVPAEVIGHLDSVATCCSAGTVALVKVDLEQIERVGK
ncbi:MAG: hypothetical protein D8M57_15750 [Candidatus Scalindua sp. AMX11]|nr:MAG: hypothetical protein DWQ00_08055 [Candidatus Scalindua sp.]NOG83331.1 hypothetical protein [Planctomycetota bacterium]RZV76769.1 MAG: hypothetical protein EX341_12095 [Candidatus Scalindua sp. SCAELEC01]TDE63953.1 MAG: hypothetical protein D8M57_15750 [Candidatus Scalindua sp. AMX11]GJQ60247.1 MAG: hypothetical protein SCALA701_30480 [Candidatus Scalindua sp.]